MGTFRTFEEIEAWQKGRELARWVYMITSRPPFASDFSLRDQMRSATVSVISNIAEGFDRDGKREFIQFLSIAKGSAAEIRAQLYIAHDLGYVTAPDFQDISRLAAETGKLIGGLIKYLKTTDLKGSKYK